MTTQMTALDPRALEELASLPAVWLVGLPVPTVARVRLPDGSITEWAIAGAGLELVPGAFTPIEVNAIVRAIEYGRITARDLSAWSAQKRLDPSFQVTLDVAMAGVAAPSPQGWSLSRVLRELDARLADAHLHDDVSTALPQAA